MEKVFIFRYAQGMSKREIPEKDPELEPGEEPASLEVEWVLSELSSNPDPESLKHSGITITPHLKPHTEKVRGLLPASASETSAASETQDKAFFEKLPYDVAQKKDEVDQLLAELQSDAEKIQEIGDEAENPVEAQASRRNLRSITQKIAEIKEAQAHFEVMADSMQKVETQSPAGIRLYQIGAWTLIKIGTIAKERVCGRGPDSEVSILPRLDKLSMDFHMQYAEYMKGRGK